jgi:hypothetical protein
MNNPEEIVLESGVNCIIHLLEFKKIAFSRLQIRSFFKEKFENSAITLNDVSICLKKLGIKNTGYSLSKISDIKQSFLPIISYNFDKKSSTNEFIVITKIDSDFIYYINNYGELQNEKKASFKKNWNNIILKVIINKKSIKGHLSYLKKEASEKNNYTKSIKIVDNFLSSSECDYIINFYKKNQLFQKSRLTALISINDEQSFSYQSNYRTSESCLLEMKNEKIDIIYQKVKSLLKIKLSQIEPLQCVRYKKNTYFAPHFDSNELLNRKYTLLIYLNDDFSGGETYFPELKKSIKPKKGTALLFKNFINKKRSTIYSLHAGLPVSKGVKYACNIWIKGK